MKRVCTLRKVLRSLSKVLLEKLFYRSYISWLLSPLSSYCFCDISSQEIFHVANISIFFETCKFLSIFFSKKANFLMFFIKQPPYWASNPSIFPVFLHFADIKPKPYYIQGPSRYECMSIYQECCFLQITEKNPFFFGIIPKQLYLCTKLQVILEI